MTMPREIEALVGTRTYTTDSVGRSGAEVRLYPDHVLKIRPASPFAAGEARILDRLAGLGLPVPGIAAHAERDGLDWLLMTRVPGRFLCAPEVMTRPALLLDCLAEGLRTLWDADIADFPFRRTLTDRLDRAEQAIRAGTYDPAGCDPATFGPGGFASPAALLDWLRDHRPPETAVLTHGDYCLPNLFTDGRRLSGMIDLGDCAVSDPWRDLARGWWSLKYNSDGHFGTYPGIDPDDLFRAAGVPKDEERLRYFLLMDELS